MPELQSPTQSAVLPESAALSYSIDDWKRGYESQPREFDYWIDDVEGDIPAALKGTLFRNGPGMLDVGGEPIAHPFDGDGYICKITFQDGRAHFRSRYVKTEGYLAEQKAQKILYRGVFGTAKSGGLLGNIFDLKLKNIANTHIMPWGKKLWALWEAAEPHQLNPETLDTIGLDLLDGILNPGDAFAAHPRIDPGTVTKTNPKGDRRLVNFAAKPGLSTAITIYEFDESGELANTNTVTVPGFAFLHDFALTPNYAIFFQNPVQFNPLPFLFGMRSAGQCLKFDPKQPTRAIAIPRDPNGEVKTFETNPSFVFHHANAFEQDGKLVVDSVCYESFPSVDPDMDFLDIDFDTIPAGELWRYELDLGTGGVKGKIIEKRCVEFPVVHPDYVGQSQRYAYIAATHNETGNAPLQGVLKIDWESGDRQLHSFAPRGFGSEPIFVPCPDGAAEDDGWVLVLSYTAAGHRSELAILDARDLTAGPVATLKLKHHVPYGLHGSFTNTVYGEQS
ncbi:MAG: carotenoid oxygenase family protein [Cyanophyceae cyanobacterium]